MAAAVRARLMSRKRTVAYALGAALLVLLLVAGFIFVNSISVTRVTDNARSLHWTNATMGTSALTRAGLVQAVTFAELSGTNTVDTTDLDFAMEQVSASVSELEDLYALDVGRDHDSHPSLERFLGAASQAVAALESGDVPGAKVHIATDLESSYLLLSDELMLEQQSILAAIDDNTDDGRALNDWAVFVLTLAVPGSAVLVYLVVARRQMRDMKERNRLELEAERQISRAKDSFIAGLSHELRTPLTSIYGFAEVLTDGSVQGREATEETAQIIANEAAEMTRMVDDLLAASRLESTGVEIEIATTNARNVVEAAITPFRRAGMEIEWEPRDALIETDAARLRHVLVNLLSNAARHGGSNIGIEITEGGGSVDIEVWDDGSGVPEELNGRLFDRFVHDDDAPLLTGSVGLGLAVASRLTDLMGGNLRYQRFGGTTYFVVKMPAAIARDEGDTGELERSDAGAAETESVADTIRALSA